MFGVGARGGVRDLAGVEVPTNAFCDRCFVRRWRCCRQSRNGRRRRGIHRRCRCRGFRRLRLWRRGLSHRHRIRRGRRAGRGICQRLRRTLGRAASDRHRKKNGANHQAQPCRPASSAEGRTGSRPRAGLFCAAGVHRLMLTCADGRHSLTVGVSNHELQGHIALCGGHASPGTSSCPDRYNTPAIYWSAASSPTTAAVRTAMPVRSMWTEPARAAYRGRRRVWRRCWGTSDRRCRV